MKEIEHTFDFILFFHYLRKRNSIFFFCLHSFLSQHCILVHYRWCVENIAKKKIIFIGFNLFLIISSKNKQFDHK